MSGHNPYFSRWFSAIIDEMLENAVELGHNPYFSRWFSAMIEDFKLSDLKVKSQSLF